MSQAERPADIGRVWSAVRFNPMVDAVIFDFDGVIADTEPLHYRAFREVLRGRGIDLSQAEYFAKYVGLNDATLLRRILEDRGLPLSDADALRAQKDAAYEQLIAQGLELLPGVREFVENASVRRLLAICSGARRSEIQAILRQHELERYFSAVVSTEDVPISKPDPAGFLRALELLRERLPSLRAEQCVVVEDSLLGIQAARSAGMHVLAVLGPKNHPSRIIGDRRAAEADWICENLDGLRVEQLDASGE